MELYHLCVTVVFGLMIAAISKASLCPMTYAKDNGCIYYTATSTGNNTCYIHITDKASALRKSESSSVALLDFTEIKINQNTKPNDESKNNTKSAKPETKRMNITESIEAKWTRIQAISSGGGEPRAYVIGTEEFPVPNNFSKIRTFIWVRGSLHYTNDTKCFPESATTAGPPEQWWLYVIIGVLIMIAALLAVTTVFQKRRKTNVHDAMVLCHRDRKASMSDYISKDPQVPDFYGNTEGGLETASNPEEHIYEDPDLYAVTHMNVNDNGEPVTCGKENSGGRPLSTRQGPTTRRGSAHDSKIRFLVPNSSKFSNLKHENT